MGVTGRRAFTSPAAIVRFLPATIRTWGASEGLPFGEGDNVEVTAFAVAGQQAYLETTGGMYALSGSKGADEETWSRLGPDRAPGPDPFDLGRVAVVSGHDAWVSTGGGGLLWQLDGGTWRQVEIPPIGGSGDQSASGLVALPDGSIAITSPAGSMVRSGTDWTLLDAAPSIALAVGPDHDLYIARGGSDPNSGDTLAERTVLRFHRTKAGGWTHGTISTPTEVTSIDAIAIDPAGGVWIRGLSDGVQALWRRTGTTWSRLPALPGSYQFEGTIAVDRQGVLWGGLSSGVSGDPGVAARYDGRSWSIVGRDDSMRFFGTHDITVLRDGRAWVDADGVGLAMQTGGVASLVLPGSFGAMAVDPEGSIYVIGPSGLYRLH